MGSQLGLPRAAPLPADILWLDPLDIQLGRLAALRLAGPTRDRVARRGAVLLPAPEAVSARAGIRGRVPRLRLAAVGGAARPGLRRAAACGAAGARRGRGAQHGGSGRPRRAGAARHRARRAGGAARHPQLRLVRRGAGTAGHLCGGAQGGAPGAAWRGRRSGRRGVQHLSRASTTCCPRVPVPAAPTCAMRSCGRARAPQPRASSWPVPGRRARSSPPPMRALRR